MTDDEIKQAPPQPILIQASSAPGPELDETVVPPQFPAPLTETAAESTGVMQEAIAHYKTVLAGKPNNTGLHLLGIVFLIILPTLISFTALENGDFDVLGVCCGSMIGGLLFLLVAIVRDSEWEKLHKVAQTQIINQAGLETPPVSKTPLVAAGVLLVAWFMSFNLPFYYSDVISLVTFLLFAGAVIVASISSSNANKVLKRNIAKIVEHHEEK